MKEEIRDFLNTGLLEQYVLGLTDLSETQTVEEFIQNYPEVRSVYNQLQDGMEQLASASAVPAPSAVKDSVMHSIDNNIQYDSPKTKTSSFWLAFAAGTAILLGAFSFYNWNAVGLKNQEIIDLKNEFATFKEDCENRQLKFAEIQARLEFINAPQTEKYLLEGNAKAANFQTIAYWNDEQKKSMLQVLDLPELPQKRCFQMWADVDGEMLNLGVLKKGEDTLPVDWKYLANAESLNITIEPEGGSDHPTVADLVANISI